MLTHRQSKTKLYKTWKDMKQRCLNPKDAGYKNYGGRGIRVSHKWLRFEGFFEDMGYTYKEGMTLERMDYNGDYCWINCMWIPKRQQSRNRRGVQFFEFGGKKKTLGEWADFIGIKKSTIRQRYYVYHWDFKKAIKEVSFGT